jgi:hypothetical protein
MPGCAVRNVPLRPVALLYGKCVHVPRLAWSGLGKRGEAKQAILPPLI